MKFFLAATIYLITFLFPASGQGIFEISFGTGYSVSSRIYPFANVSDYDLRELEIGLGSRIFPHFALSYDFNEELAGVVSVEYLTKKTEYYGQTVDSDLGTIYIPVKDGYTFVPVELTLEYRLPFSSENFRVNIGGGGGLYFYNSLRETAGIPLSKGASKVSYGIHVLTGMEYYLNQKLSFFFTMKFRDPEVEFDGEYASLEGTFNGKKVTLGNKNFYQKLSLEGSVFLLGVKYGL
jgi:hypothetical protein